MHPKQSLLESVMQELQEATNSAVNPGFIDPGCFNWGYHLDNQRRHFCGAKSEINQPGFVCPKQCETELNAMPNAVAEHGQVPWRRDRSVVLSSEDL